MFPSAAPSTTSLLQDSCGRPLYPPGPTSPPTVPPPLTLTTMVLLLLCFPLVEAEPVGTEFWKLWFPGFQPWLGAYTVPRYLLHAQLSFRGHFPILLIPST